LSTTTDDFQRLGIAGTIAARQRDEAADEFLQTEKGSSSQSLGITSILLLLNAGFHEVPIWQFGTFDTATWEPC
jgi:hypothetical protein